MKLDVIYFASVREAVGVSREVVEPDDSVRTAADLIAWLRARGGAWADALAPGRAIRIAVDKAIVRMDASLRDGAEVAIFPPVTGG